MKDTAPKNVLRIRFADAPIAKQCETGDLLLHEQMYSQRKKSTDQLFKYIYSIDDSSQIKMNQRKIPKPRKSNGVGRPRIRKSYNSSSAPTVNKFSNKIPEFYNVEPPELESQLKKIYPLKKIITPKILQNLLVDHLGLPSFFALPFMVTLNPLILETRVLNIQYSEFQWFAIPKLEHATLPEKVFRIFLGNNKRDYLIKSDIIPYIASLVNSHPSISFLEQEPTYQSSFIRCIITRIFYELDPEMRGKIYFSKLSNSNFCDCLLAVDKADDVSDVSDFFSYEHFYVLMSKFWEIDVDEKNVLTIEQLSEYDNNRIPLILCKRLMYQLNPKYNPKAITFTEFILFMLAVEDKSSETALRIWFNVCDFDGDGLLSMCEIRQLYKMQKEKMKSNSMDVIKFRFVFSQLIDLFGPTFFKDGYVTISSLSRTKNWETFFNVLVDLKKFNEWNNNPRFDQLRRDKYKEMKTWDIFCEIEYSKLS